MVFALFLLGVRVLIVVMVFALFLLGVTILFIVMLFALFAVVILSFEAELNRINPLSEFNNNFVVGCRIINQILQPLLLQLQPDREH